MKIESIKSTTSFDPRSRFLDQTVNGGQSMLKM